jgi:ATPase family associated with various cellular activities (AAA)
MTRLRELAVAHLRLRLLELHPLLDAAVREQAVHVASMERQDLRAICITEGEALRLIEDARRVLAAPDAAAARRAAVTAASAPEAELRRTAAAAGVALPLDRLAAALAMTEFEQIAVLLCAAPELDRGFERIYAFILDDMARRAPCVELLALLGASSVEERIGHRHALSRFGKLRRSGALVAGVASGSELRQELRLGDGLFDHLTGDGSDLAALVRDSIIAPPAAGHAADPRVARLGEALCAGDLRTVGVWGAPRDGTEEVGLAFADAVGAGVRRWTPPATESGAAATTDLRAALQEASVAGALLWIETDPLADPTWRDAAGAVAEELARAEVRVILSGNHPWRPPALIAAAGFGEIELGGSTLERRVALWREEAPGLDASDAAEMARRLRLSRLDLRAAVRLAKGEAMLDGESSEGVSLGRLRRATGALTGARCRQFAMLVRPKRGPEDLILPQALHRQVLEIAQFFRAWPTVAETWGFGRLSTGEGGIKALFTGESGTGKTLAAEVVAGALNMPLLRVELSRVVSKWVGETEKNLDATFAEAEDSQAVLLFDEADALFGKRGAVESGIDRYANLEVSHLLQRLDDYGGLVILASNLKDNIDAAFTRRFQAVLYFPRPEKPERLRLWRAAFPLQAPVDASVDFDALANLDMTGASIVGAARTAALFAAEEDVAEIGKTHIVRAVARQFRREARLLTPVELGPYAGLLQEMR